MDARGITGQVVVGYLFSAMPPERGGLEVLAGTPGGLSRGR